MAERHLALVQFAKQQRDVQRHKARPHRAEIAKRCDNQIDEPDEIRLQGHGLHLLSEFSSTGWNPWASAASPFYFDAFPTSGYTLGVVLEITKYGHPVLRE